MGRERILAIVSQRPVTFLAWIGCSDETAGLHSAKDCPEALWTVGNWMTTEEIEEWLGG
jgi:hypothetical protein